MIPHRNLDTIQLLTALHEKIRVVETQAQSVQFQLSQMKTIADLLLSTTIPSVPIPKHNTFHSPETSGSKSDQPLVKTLDRARSFNKIQPKRPTSDSVQLEPDRIFMDAEKKSQRDLWMGLFSQGDEASKSKQTSISDLSDSNDAQISTPQQATTMVDQSRNETEPSRRESVISIVISQHDKSRKNSAADASLDLISYSADNVAIKKLRNANNSGLNRGASAGGKIGMADHKYKSPLMKETKNDSMESSQSDVIRYRKASGERSHSLKPDKSQEDFPYAVPAFEIEQPASSRISRKSTVNSVIISAINAKYNLKGSIASIQHDDVPEGSIIQKFLSRGINPLSGFSASRELWMGILYIIVLWVVPFKIGFSTHLEIYYSIFLSVFYALDTLIEFITFRDHHKALRLLPAPSLKDWQLHYLRSNLIVDILTSVPFELLPLESAKYLWIIRMIRLYKLPRIMTKSAKFLAIRKGLEKLLGLGQSFSGIFPLLFCLCAFLHVQACAIFLAGATNKFSNSNIASVEFKSTVDQYIWALYVAAGNTFPLAYKPNTSGEYLTVVFFIISGAALYAAIVGTMSSIAMGIDASGRLYKQKIDELKDYMKWKDLSPTTQRKVIKYYEVKYRGKFFEEQTLLHEMNDSLRMEIAAHNCRSLITKVPFLNRKMKDGRDDVFIGKVAMALSAFYFVPGDIVLSAGSTEPEMFFISSGSVDIYLNGKKISNLTAGHYFGELCLLSENPHCSTTVQAISSSVIYRLHRAELIPILHEFEDMRIKIASHCVQDEYNIE